jgi:hypothetical protein
MPHILKKSFLFIDSRLSVQIAVEQESRSPFHTLHSYTFTLALLFAGSSTLDVKLFALPSIDLLAAHSPTPHHIVLKQFFGFGFCHLVWKTAESNACP